MNFTCNECNDSGSRDKLGTYLDCNACGTAATRRDLNDFVKSLGPTHPEDVALAIHQRALAIGLADAVEGVLTEMQPGGALHMPQEPVAHLKFWAAQSWSGNGNHDIDCGEGFEVCEPGEIGADGKPAFPVFMHAIPGALAMAPKQEARKPTDISKRLREYAGNNGYSHNNYADTMRAAADEIERYYGSMLNWKKTAEAKDAAPAAANGALTDEREIFDRMYLSMHGFHTKAELDKEWHRTGAMFCAALASGPDAALVKALESALAIINNEADPDEYADSLKAIRAALSGAKGN